MRSGVVGGEEQAVIRTVVVLKVERDAGVKSQVSSFFALCLLRFPFPHCEVKDVKDVRAQQQPPAAYLSTRVMRSISFTILEDVLKDHSLRVSEQVVV